jgi:hypothetical protein
VDFDETKEEITINVSRAIKPAKEKKEKK